MHLFRRTATSTPGCAAVFATLLIAVTVAGCGNGGSATAPRVTASKPTPAPSSPSPGHVSGALQGVWAQRSQDGGPPQLLRITDSTYGFYTSPGDVASGPLVGTPSTLTFQTSTTCVGSGTYTWTLHGKVLRFRPAGTDPCPRGTFLAAGPWHRRGR
jgi:hypothetical protein